MAPITSEVDESSEAYDAGYAEGLEAGKLRGAAQERERFAAIVRLCENNRRHLAGAVDLALTLPDITAERAVEMATRLFNAADASAQSKLPGSSYLMGSFPDRLARFGG
ncbi:hypothetical protein [Mesorhizobium argentiipisi]|uniref:Uncharacterized protein n=1 Tax=Mesorhizobium argentiipisi TaxID=3015175 RepID=A0ABU8KCW8_9HYPH